MYCNKCGKEIIESSVFCNFCGNEILLEIKSKKIKLNEQIHIESTKDYIWTCDYCGKEFNTKSESDDHEKKCEKNPTNFENNSIIYCAKCGVGNSNKAKFCKNCGEELTLKVTEKGGETIEEGKKNSKPGLTGWLAIIGLGLIIAFFRQGYSLFSIFSVLSTPLEIPGFSTLIQFEVVGNIAFLFFIVYVIYLYFKKNIKFPKYYIIYLIFPVIFSLTDIIWLGSLSFPTQEVKKVFDDSITKASGELLQSVIFGIIWVTYMIKSEQVKRTFTNNEN